MKVFLIICLFSLISSKVEHIDLKDYSWQFKFNFPARGLDNKAIQGGAYYKGKFYQFHDKTGGIRVFDTKIYKQIGDIDPKDIDARLHHGSATFSDEFSYEINGTKVTTQLPLVYSSGHYDNQEIIDVLDIENNVIVRQYFFGQRIDDVIGAFDFEHNRMWLLGYRPNETAITPWTVDEYEFNEDRSELTHVGETDIIEIYDNTLQECHYYNGHIYILSGWGPKHNQTVTLRDYNLETKKIEYSLESPTNDEGEGIDLIPESKTFIVTTWSGTNASYWEVVKEEKKTDDARYINNFKILLLTIVFLLI